MLNELCNICGWKSFYVLMEAVKQDRGHRGKQEQRKIYSKMGFTTLLSLFFLIGPILPPQARWQPTVARRPQTVFIWLQQNNCLELCTQKHRESRGDQPRFRLHVSEREQERPRWTNARQEERKQTGLTKHSTASSSQNFLIRV